ncbi:MAG: PIN domain-containing protein [Candidatus Hydrogenedentes bacterium]|nr:PIN domain-containing protein [Candidatus Hydrogenedentota bacterium]
MSGEFIDTNVFIYLFDETAPDKQRIADQIVFGALETASACTSFQVVQETLNVLTRKVEKPMSAGEARDFLDAVLVPLWRVMPSPTLYRRGIELQSRYQHGFYDALIIAAALDGGCSVLYSEDLRHEQRIEGLTIRNPFVD